MSEFTPLWTCCCDSAPSGGPGCYCFQYLSSRTFQVQWTGSLTISSGCSCLGLWNGASQSFRNGICSLFPPTVDTSTWNEDVFINGASVTVAMNPTQSLCRMEGFSVGGLVPIDDTLYVCNQGCVSRQQYEGSLYNPWRWYARAVLYPPTGNPNFNPFWRADFQIGVCKLVGSTPTNAQVRQYSYRSSSSQSCAPPSVPINPFNPTLPPSSSVSGGACALEGLNSFLVAHTPSWTHVRGQVVIS